MLYINIHDECFGDGTIPLSKDGVTFKVEVGSKIYTVGEENYKRVISIDNEPQYEIKSDAWRKARMFIREGK